MSLVPFLRCCAVVLLVGCEMASPIDESTMRRGPRTTPAAPPPPGVTGRAPLTVTLIGPESPHPGVPLVLEARIERRMRLPVPIAVSLVLPAHVTLLEGASELELAPNADADVQTLRFVVRVDSKDMHDLGEIKLALHAVGQSFGLHAEPTYRFGRTLTLTPLTRTGSELRIAGRSFGRSIDLTPR